MIRSPFQFASYEPRFVIEDNHPSMLHHAIALWHRCDWKTGGVTFVARYPTALLMTRGDHAGAIHPWERLSAPLETAELVPYIARWLETAEVEEPQPNFDGLEAKGFCAFWGYFGCQEVKSGYGAFIVQTKWIEIHK